MITKQIIDESCEQTRQRYSLTRVYGIGQERVRVRIQRDFYRFQSHAVAEVLTADRTWNSLVTQPTHIWWESTPVSTGDVVQTLSELSDDLASRAALILIVST
jgi:hypothetical protein